MIPKLTRLPEVKPVAREEKAARGFAETLEKIEKPEEHEDGRRMRQAPAVHGSVVETRPADRTSAGRRPLDRLLLLGHGEVMPKLARAPKTASPVMAKAFEVAHQAFAKAVEAQAAHPAPPKAAAPVVAPPPAAHGKPAEPEKKDTKGPESAEPTPAIVGSADRAPAPAPAPTPVKAIEAPVEVKAVVEQMLQHLDAAQVRHATAEVRMTVNLGAMGDVAVRVEPAHAAGPLRVVMQASEASTATLLKDGVATLAQALELKGYVAPVVEVKHGEASGGLHEEKRGERGFARWEAAADDEAAAAAMGRRARDGRLHTVA